MSKDKAKTFVDSVKTLLDATDRAKKYIIVNAAASTAPDSEWSQVVDELEQAQANMSVLLVEFMYDLLSAE